jgi:hypothetical protein
VTTGQQLPDSDRRRIARTNPILKFLRRAFFVMVGAVVVVDGAVILADFHDRYLFASIADTLGVVVAGNTCNIAIGAKMLFWLQSAIDFCIVALALSLRPTVAELQQAHRALDFQSLKGVPKGPKMYALILAAGVVFYFAAYSLGYSQSARLHPCSPLTLGQVLHYWYILMVCLARAIPIFLACAFYFDHKATQASQSGRPLT